MCVCVCVHSIKKNMNLTKPLHLLLIFRKYRGQRNVLNDAKEMAATNQIHNVGEDDKVMTSLFNKPTEEKRKREDDTDEKRFKAKTKQIL